MPIKCINGYLTKDELDLNNLIAVSGVKGSGKDSVSSMIQFCLSVPKWMQTYWIYKNFRRLIHKKYKRVAFADPLKGMLATLLNIPEEWFSNRSFKEFYVVNIPDLEISSDSINRLSDSKFNKLVKNLDPSLTESKLTIRQLMQYFGTQVMQTYFGRNVWINSTLKNAKDNTIITDLRFKAEYEAVKNSNGIIIYVSRPNCEFGQHASEREMEELLNNNKYDYVIENDGSIQELFNKVKKICNDL